MIIIISVVVGWRGDWSGRRQYTVSLILSGIITLVLMKVANQFISDPRPFVVGHFTPLIPHAADNGFPSDHTAISAVFALAVWHFSRRWGIGLLVLTALVGAARVAAGVHHPLDIIGAIVLAVVGTLIGWAVTRRFFGRPSADQPSDN